MPSSTGPAQPRVTVVVPTLAADEKLAHCLDSLERQTFPGFEVVVVGAVPRSRVLASG